MTILTGKARFLGNKDMVVISYYNGTTEDSIRQQAEATAKTYDYRIDVLQIYPASVGEVQHGS